MQSQTPAPTPSWRNRTINLYKQYEVYTPAAFFLGGFILDLFTLGRIDDSSNWIMQILYLGLGGGLLFWLFLEPNAPESTLNSKWKSKVYEYRTEAMHFCFGALLSVYTIFYFKSSSLVSSFTFMFILAALLIANELDFFKRQGLFLKFALFALCVVSFVAYFVPLLLGQIGTWIFLLSLLLSSIIFALFFVFFRKKGVENHLLLTHYFRPTALIIILFLLLYLFRILPPVPLSLQFIGAYHNVEKVGEEYKLTHEREAWRLWNKGDQYFRAQPGDRLYIFFQLFSPSDFTETVYLEWYIDDPRSGWTLQDRIPIEVRGGRDEGFRGFGFKSNYQEGDWRVLVTTSDRREIGRMSVTVENQKPNPREWKHDFH